MEGVSAHFTCKYLPYTALLICTPRDICAFLFKTNTKHKYLLTITRSEEECNGVTNPPMYEGPTGTPGKEPCFEDPRPKWYKCATIDL